MSEQKHITNVRARFDEALKEFMATYVADENFGAQDDVRDCWRLAKAAIAKAEGQG